MRSPSRAQLNEWVAEATVDCSNDSECRGGLVCKPNVGAHFGKPATFDMCVKP